MPQKVIALCFEAAGEPASMNLSFEEFEIPDPGPNEVQIAFLFSPVTPTDILAITGKYSLGPLRKLPRALMKDTYVAGYDGVARVTKVGQFASVPKHVWEKYFRKDDIVIPLRMGIGTWCSHANIDEKWLLNLSCDPFSSKSTPRSFSPIHIETFSHLRSSIFTGLFLLRMSFLDMKHNHWIVMSEPVDPISWAIISLAKVRRANVLVLLADQPEMKGPARLDPRKRILKDHGVDCVLLESEFERYQEEIENMRIVALFENGSAPSVSLFIPFIRVGGSLVNYSLLCGRNKADPFNVVYYQREEEIHRAPTLARPMEYTYNSHMDFTEHHFSTLDYEMDRKLRNLVVRSRIKTPTVKRIPWSARDQVLEAVSAVETQDTWRDMYVFDFEA
ncbi:NAD(P)-binding protein [Penicillium malachiteum]|uniref:NAD(P)-binding protein n=1 Tax=Penicillium malachiteum TaxID=1324776 RepID=A0AAD6MR29_9EURO|nr:NAD(P)-binding protein [Penicillium malachiteum]